MQNLSTQGYRVDLWLSLEEIRSIKQEENYIIYTYMFV